MSNSTHTLKSSSRIYDTIATMATSDSYTNSSDGLDIYDRIGQSLSSQQNKGKLHHSVAIATANQNQSRRIPAQVNNSTSIATRMFQSNIGKLTNSASNGNCDFLPDTATAPPLRCLAGGNNSLEHRASEIHVGEWENMYDR